MDVNVERTETGAVVHVRGEVDLATSPALADALAGITTREGPVVVDLTEVGFLDSSGLSVLLQARERLAAGSGLRLVVTKPALQRVLAVTGLDEVFTIAPTVDEALAGT
jgi:anti-sigma B factor antagonist